LALAGSGFEISLGGGWIADSANDAWEPAERFQPIGGTTCTMLLHLGQARMSPIADSSRTLSRALQVVQWMMKSSTAGYLIVVCGWSAGVNELPNR
jgi:hypothetical protein